MFKKAGYILLTSLLIFSTVGFVVSRHYCNQLLVSVTLDSPADQCCDDMSGGCCHNENEYVVLKTDFVQPAAEQINIAVIDVFDIELLSLIVETVSENTNSDHFSHTSLKPEKSKSLALIQSYLL